MSEASLTNEICERYSAQEIKPRLSIAILEAEDGRPSVLIQGDHVSLRFLGDILIALGSPECSAESVDLSPTGAGSVFFDPASDLGVYIRRVQAQRDRAP